ncbi:MAG: YihA family ribosome biogenesis GTP-binding protein [Candidatus Competibacter sp.]|nr:YihA family ribosome biogenesis GTP-binding protein [Candidatus Competibacter sp.]
MRNPNEAGAIAADSTAAKRYRGTCFLSSANALAQLPPATGREVAFAGRSNAGKSSALNLLTGQRGLARTSKTPGRTQLLNIFRVRADRYLVDLPGYGYARVPEAMRQHWKTLVGRYLSERGALRGLMLVMDARHPLTDLDLQLLAACAARDLPVHILLTKADKLSRGKAAAVLRSVRGKLVADFPAASAQLFSALSGAGAAEAHSRLDEWLEDREG